MQTVKIPTPRRPITFKQGQRVALSATYTESMNYAVCIVDSLTDDTITLKICPKDAQY